MSRRQILVFAAAACVACCIGPILGVLSAIAALGVVSTLFIGFAGLAVAGIATAVFIFVRRRRSGPCAAGPDPIEVELSRPAPWTR